MAMVRISSLEYSACSKEYSCTWASMMFVLKKKTKEGSKNNFLRHVGQMQTKKAEEGDKR